MGETRYSYAIDIWSCACVLVQMLTMFPPFTNGNGESELDLFRQICNLCGAPTKENWPKVEALPWYQPMMGHLRNSKPSKVAEKDEIFYKYTRCILSDPFLKWHLSDEALHFVDFMLVLDPEKRPTADEVLCAPYFRSDPVPKYVEIENKCNFKVEQVNEAMREMDSEQKRKKRKRKRKRRRESGGLVEDSPYKRMRNLSLSSSATRSVPPENSEWHNSGDRGGRGSGGRGRDRHRGRDGRDGRDGANGPCTGSGSGSVSGSGPNGPGTGPNGPGSGPRGRYRYEYTDPSSWSNGNGGNLNHGPGGYNEYGMNPNHYQNGYGNHTNNHRGGGHSGPSNSSFSHFQGAPPMNQNHYGDGNRGNRTDVNFVDNGEEIRFYTNSSNRGDRRNPYGGTTRGGRGGPSTGRGGGGPSGTFNEYPPYNREYGSSGYDPNAYGGRERERGRGRGYRGGRGRRGRGDSRDTRYDGPRGPPYGGRSTRGRGGGRYYGRGPRDAYVPRELPREDHSRETDSSGRERDRDCFGRDRDLRRRSLNSSSSHRRKRSGSPSRRRHRSQSRSHSRSKSASRHRSR